jgi:hypothetical protein
MKVRESESPEPLNNLCSLESIRSDFPTPGLSDFVLSEISILTPGLPDF